MATEAEIHAVLTQNGFFPNGHAVGRADVARVNLTAIGHNGKPMIFHKGEAAVHALATVEAWKRRADIADIKYEEV